MAKSEAADVKLYQSKLKLRSASASYWQADMVFGHLCWHLARSDEPERLDDLLRRCEAWQPPILLSDGFPGDFLPRPVLPRVGVSEQQSKQERINRLREAKRVGQSVWLDLDDFNRVRRGEIPLNLPAEDAIRQALRSNVTAKNQINRLTDTTGAGGELFDMEEIVLPKVTIYWRIEEDWEKTVRDFLEDLKASGYGKRKSVGYGQIESFTFEEFHGFDETPPQANGFISLSRFVPAPDDPTDGYWDIAVKYGKLGEELAVSGQPFKKPLIQLECGSCFFDEVKPDWVNRWYGQLVDGIAPQHPEVKQYGFAFLVPMRIAREANRQV